jgi:hypothetical protein
VIVVEVSPAVKLGVKQFDPETRDKILVNTGGVQREAQLLAEAIRRLGFEVVQVPPIRKAKWTDEEFQLATGSHQSSNSHEKDAVRLAFHYKNKR